MMTRSNVLRISVGLLGLTCTLGCGHTQDSVAAATKPELVGEALAAAQRTVSPEEKTREPVASGATPTAAEDPPPIATDSIEGFMLEHFVISTWARDSIVDGDLEAIRSPLLALAEYSYASVAPGGWMNGIAQMQAAARLTAGAQTLRAAASGIAAMGRTCGQCHRERGGPVVQYYMAEDGAPKSDRLEGRMLRHAWAVERLWEGLTAPSDNAWMAGASALTLAPAAAPETQPPLTPAVTKTLELVRTLGKRAIRADSAEAREKVYGELLVTCAECHRSAPQVE
jgi:mono/diheme cytochrome c family protein